MRKNVATANGEHAGGVQRELDVATLSSLLGRKEMKVK
jgi:hypothetical protein